MTTTQKQAETKKLTTKFALLNRRQEVEAAHKTGYLTHREYADAMKELEQLWQELVVGK